MAMNSSTTLIFVVVAAFALMSSTASASPPAPRIVDIKRPDGVSSHALLLTENGLWLGCLDGDRPIDNCARFVSLDGKVQTIETACELLHAWRIAGADIAYRCAEGDPYVERYDFYTQSVGGAPVKMFSHKQENAAFHDRADACVKGREIFRCTTKQRIGTLATSMASFTVAPTPTGWFAMSGGWSAYTIASFTMKGERIFERKVDGIPHLFDGGALVAVQDYERKDVAVYDTATGRVRFRAGSDMSYEVAFTSTGDVLLVPQSRLQVIPYRNGKPGALMKLDAYPEVSASIAYVGDRALWDKGVLRFILSR